MSIVRPVVYGVTGSVVFDTTGNPEYDGGGRYSGPGLTWPESAALDPSVDRSYFFEWENEVSGAACFSTGGHLLQEYTSSTNGLGASTVVDFSAFTYTGAEVSENATVNNNAFLTAAGTMLALGQSDSDKWYLFRSDTGDHTTWSTLTDVLKPGTDDVAAHNSLVRSLGRHSFANITLRLTAGGDVPAVLFGEYTLNGSNETLVLWISQDDGLTWTEFWRVNDKTTRNFRHIHSVWQSPIDGPDGTFKPIIVCLGESGGVVMGPSSFADATAAATGWSAVNEKTVAQMQTYADANAGWAFLGTGSENVWIDILFHNNKIYTWPDTTSAKGIWEFNGTDLSGGTKVFNPSWQNTEDSLGCGAITTPGGNLLIANYVNTSMTTSKMRINMSTDGRDWAVVGHLAINAAGRTNIVVPWHLHLDDLDQIRFGNVRKEMDPDNEVSVILKETTTAWDGIEKRLNVDFVKYWKCAGSNDGRERVGTDWSNSFHEWGEQSGTEYMIGMNMTHEENVAPTAGATIVEAIITLKMNKSQGTEQKFVFEARTGGTHAVCSDPANLPSSWTTTPSVVTSQEYGPLVEGVDFDDLDFLQFDVTTMIQQVVDAAGWAATSNINVRIRTTGLGVDSLMGVYNGTQRMWCRWYS